MLTENHTIRNHPFTEISTMMILQNMGKDKDKLKENNTLERNNTDTLQTEIVN